MTSASLDKPDSPYFIVYEEYDHEKERPVRAGHFDMEWDEQGLLESIEGNLDRQEITMGKGLDKIQALIKKYPRNLAFKEAYANLLAEMGLTEEALEAWESSYKNAVSHMPKGFKGLIPHDEYGGGCFLNIAHGYLLALIQAGRAKEAKALSNKMLNWSPRDGHGIRFIKAQIEMLLGDTSAAKKNYEKWHGSPVSLYQLGRIAFNESNFIKACTYFRKGFAENPYIAEGIAGRTLLSDRPYFHGSNIYSSSEAIKFLESPIPPLGQKEISFVNWLFNCSDVLLERSQLMVINEGLTYEPIGGKRNNLVHQRMRFFEGITDALSVKLVRRVKNRYGQEVWPWEWTHRWNPDLQNTEAEIK